MSRADFQGARRRWRAAAFNAEENGHCSGRVQAKGTVGHTQLLAVRCPQELCCQNAQFLDPNPKTTEKWRTALPIKLCEGMGLPCGRSHARSKKDYTVPDYAFVSDTSLGASKERLGYLF